jgi:hypothetical protein
MNGPSEAEDTVMQQGKGLRVDRDGLFRKATHRSHLHRGTEHQHDGSVDKDKRTGVLGNDMR